jgi:D-alanine-D-alanine ligase
MGKNVNKLSARKVASINKANSKDSWKQLDLVLSPCVIANAIQVIPEIDFALPWAVKPILDGCPKFLKIITHPIKLKAINVLVF